MSSEEQHLVENTAELYPATLYIQKELNTSKKMKKDLDSSSLVGTRGKRLWIYDNICDPPEPRCMLVHVNHSHCGDE